MGCQNAAQRLAASVFLLELLDTAGGIHQLLLTGKERVAGAADLDVDFFFHRARFKNAAASAGHFGNLVVGVNFFFHLQFLPASNQP